MRIRPHEIVTNSMEKLEPHLSEDTSRSVLPEKNFQKKNAERAILDHFHVQSLSSLGLDERDKRFIAAGALLATAVDVSLLRRPFGIYLLLAAASLLLQPKKPGRT